MDISFAWTTPAFVMGAKTVTRREWGPQYARHFREGQVVTALDRQRRYRGKVLGSIRLTRDPYPEETCEAPPEDWEAEGFALLEQLGAKVDGLAPRTLWRAWHLVSYSRPMWVVRFETLALTGYGLELKEHYAAQLAGLQTGPLL